MMVNIYLFNRIYSLGQKELQDLENEENRRVRGFREVVDLISSSQKPVVSQNYLSGYLLSLHMNFSFPPYSFMDDNHMLNVSQISLPFMPSS